MPQLATETDLEFLRELDRWISRGLPACEFAASQQISPGTITYRLNSYGLKAKRAVGLVDKRTGRRFEELLHTGEIVSRGAKDSAA